mmetsp:Transcript_13397/g.57084  ORF Transcript_13397/g.57084 Transcript_13397/m.57084 type:complete len:341 (+) Transcript_13397:381-1403(+)
MAYRSVYSMMCLLYSSLFLFPSAVPMPLSYPGSLKNGSFTKMSDWMDTITCAIVEHDPSHVSPFAPDHVPNNDKHTLPSLYRFGLRRARPPPVVLNRTFGAHAGYALGKNASKRKKPQSYGVSSGPVTAMDHKTTFCSSTRTKALLLRLMGSVAERPAISRATRTKCGPALRSRAASSANAAPTTPEGSRSLGDATTSKTTSRNASQYADSHVNASGSEKPEPEPGVSFFLPPRGFFGCGGAAAAGEGDTSATGSAGPGPARAPRRDRRGSLVRPADEPKGASASVPAALLSPSPAAAACTASCTAMMRRASASSVAAFRAHSASTFASPSAITSSMERR